MKKNRKKFEKYATKIIKKWILRLKLQNNIYLKYKKRTEEFLTVDANYPYSNANVYYGKEALDYFKNGDFEERYIVHELCHLLTEPLYTKALKNQGDEVLRFEWERLVDILSHILIENER